MLLPLIRGWYIPRYVGAGERLRWRRQRREEREEIWAIARSTALGGKNSKNLGVTGRENEKFSPALARLVEPPSAQICTSEDETFITEE